MPAGPDSPDREPRLAFEDLADALDLVLQGPPLTGGEPGEGLDGHLNLAAGASLVSDTSNHAVDEQDRIVAGLAGGRQGTCGGPAKEEPGSRLATNGVRVEVRQQQDAAFGVGFAGISVSLLATHAGRPSKLILVSFRRCRSNCSAAQAAGAPNH
jgi:hypothetical protein